MPKALTSARPAVHGLPGCTETPTYAYSLQFAIYVRYHTPADRHVPAPPSLHLRPYPTTPRDCGFPSPSHIDERTPHSVALDPDLLAGLGLDLFALGQHGARAAAGREGGVLTTCALCVSYQHGSKARTHVHTRGLLTVWLRQLCRCPW